MSNQTKILDDILYQGLRPWSEKNSVDDKFAPKLRSLKDTSTDYPFRYEINFLRPFDNKTKYYSKLILNTVKADVERLYNLISEDDTENLILYWLDDTLNKRLKTRLKDIGKLIKEKDFQLVYIDPKKASNELDQAHKANTYIIQLLKLAYMQLYLEIQDAFSTWIDDKLVIEDFFTQLLLEQVPNEQFLTEIQTIEIEATEKPVKTEIKEKRAMFDDINASLRESKKLGSSEGLRSELTSLKVYYQKFGADLTRVSSMRSMATQFASEIETLINKYY